MKITSTQLIFDQEQKQSSNHFHEHVTTPFFLYYYTICHNQTSDFHCFPFQNLGEETKILTFSAKVPKPKLQNKNKLQRQPYRGEFSQRMRGKQVLANTSYRLVIYSIATIHGIQKRLIKTKADVNLNLADKRASRSTSE